MDFSYDKAIGNKIRDLRVNRGMTQDDLAAQLQIHDCDITRSALAKIEVGQRHIYAKEIKAFKEIFRITYEELFV